jgi:hypothetical protein
MSVNQLSEINATPILDRAAYAQIHVRGTGKENPPAPSRRKPDETRA